MSNLPDTPERDPRLAAAWREHSAELPPARLDAAILAAAHRAVGSGPQIAGKRPREATSPQRWWMPIAAAATIGAVALGVLQTAPRDEPASAPSVSDMPAQSAASRMPAAPRPAVEGQVGKVAPDTGTPAQPGSSTREQARRRPAPHVQLPNRFLPTPRTRNRHRPCETNWPRRIARTIGVPYLRPRWRLLVPRRPPPPWTT